MHRGGVGVGTVSHDGKGSEIVVAVCTYGGEFGGVKEFYTGVELGVEGMKFWREMFIHGRYQMGGGRTRWECLPIRDGVEEC